MTCSFQVMDQQLDAPRDVSPGGKLVLSRMKPSRSHIGAPSPSLKLVLDGDMRYEIDGREITARPGEFLYLDAGSPCIGSNRTDMTGLCLLLPPEASSWADRSMVANDPLMGRALIMSARASAMGRTLDAYARRIAADPSLGNLLADELVARVRYAIAEPLADSKAAMDGLKAAKLSTKRELYKRLERARTFLHDNDARGVTLGEMASIAGLSQFHLARYFKDAFGQSPITYHRELRLERAARLLEAGSSVADAAEATGYSDQVALSHAFRRKYGVPPNSWGRRRRAC